MSSTSLISLLGAEDNLSEPKPLINEKPTILGVVITFMILSWACGLFRLYVRLRVIYAPGWDDLMLAIYLCSTTFGSVVLCLMPDHALGEHFILQTFDQMQAYLKLFWMCNASYAMSTSFIKISLLFQYLRIFATGPIRFLCIFLIVFIGLWGTSYTVISWIPCWPVARFWNILIPGKCWGYGGANAEDFVATFESHSGMNMALDVIVFLIPVPLYFRRDTEKKTRRGLLVLLCMGSVVIFLSLWRLQSIISYRAATTPTFDPSWYAPISLVLSAIEVDIASICASAPVFWPVLKNTLTGIFVTKEIEITHEDRVDEFELHRAVSQSTTMHGQHSPSGSEVRLGLDKEGLGAEGEVEKGLGRGKSTKGHYQDSFIREQVNPFGNQKVEAKVRTHVRAESGDRGKKNKWFGSGW